MNILVCHNPAKNRQECSAASILQNLYNQGRIMVFQNTPQPDEEGSNCHEVTLALIVDLLNAGITAKWKLVKGIINPGGKHALPFSHSWIEYDGWAVEASGIFSEKNQIMIMDAFMYKRQLNAKKIKKRGVKDTIKWMRIQDGTAKRNETINY
jgi:hypothetical protein